MYVLRQVEGEVTLGFDNVNDETSAYMVTGKNISDASGQLTEKLKNLDKPKNIENPGTVLESSLTDEGFDVKKVDDFNRYPTVEFKLGENKVEAYILNANSNGEIIAAYYVENADSAIQVRGKNMAEIAVAIRKGLEKLDQ